MTEEKIIIINECSDCPHCGQNIMSEWICHDERVDGFQVIQEKGEAPDFIPDWCPLKNNQQDQCADCPGRTTPAPFTCQVPGRAQDVIGQHSGTKNKMEIMITKCHHKARVTKAAPRNREIIEEADKIVEEQRASERASAEKRETAERKEANKKG